MRIAIQKLARPEEKVMFKIHSYKILETKQLKDRPLIDNTSQPTRAKEPDQKHEQKKPLADAKANEHNVKMELNKELKARDHPAYQPSQVNKDTNTTPTRPAQSYDGLRKGMGLPPATTPRNA